MLFKKSNVACFAYWSMTLAYGQLTKTIQFRQEKCNKNRDIVKFCTFKVVVLGCQTELLNCLRYLKRF